MSIKIKFWGVRGSVPSPLTPQAVKTKTTDAIHSFVDELIRLAPSDRSIKEFLTTTNVVDSIVDRMKFEQLSTFGGNTTCVSIDESHTHNNKLITNRKIFDMGTGLRELGNDQLKTIFAEGGMTGEIYQSHVHWDHIQGIPFWKPLYMPRTKFDINFSFYGGKDWDADLNKVYRGQMTPPVFPVDLEEIMRTGMNMSFNNIFDGWQHESGFGSTVLARKLFHPQETYGYRVNSIWQDSLDSRPVSIAFTTDHEPYAEGIPDGLIQLVKGVDYWITDCQYSKDDYVGKNGPKKFGWGHSYPEYIVKVAKECGPKNIITTHHDPEASDTKVIDIAKFIKEETTLYGVKSAIAAYEGLEINV